MAEKIDLIGQKFGRLTVLERIGYIKERHSTLWVCKCDCGNIVRVYGTDLKCGNTKSCGCYKSDDAKERFTTHGCRKGRRSTRLYRIWCGMKERCSHSETDVRFRIYKGINICKEWSDSFECFRDWALSHGYEDTLSIDRIDGTGDYEPSNCRWANRTQQSINRKSSIFVSYKEKTQTISEWSKETGIKPTTLYRRYKAGWTAEEMFEIQPNGGNNQTTRKQNT